MKIWHNNRCSKSRCAVEILVEKKVEYEEFKYLEAELKSSDIQDLLKMLGIKAEDLIRRGEPIFKEKAVQLYSGTTLIDGQFTYTVSKPGHLSALARINGLVQKASTEKANIQKLADKISAIFVPLIIGISTLWFFV